MPFNCLYLSPPKGYPTMMTNFLFENFRLKKDQIFEGLTSDELDRLMGSGVTHAYKKGEIIFREGEYRREYST